MQKTVVILSTFTPTALFLIKHFLFHSRKYTAAANNINDSSFPFECQ